jgi:hypothetical protein
VAVAFIADVNAIATVCGVTPVRGVDAGVNEHLISKLPVQASVIVSRKSVVALSVSVHLRPGPVLARIRRLDVDAKHPQDEALPRRFPGRLSP